MTGIAWVLGSTSLGSHWLFLFQSGKKLSHRLCLLSPASPAKKKSRSTQKSFAKSRSSPLTLTLTSFLSRLSGGFLICPTLQCPWQPLKFGQQPANDGVKKSTESKKKKQQSGRQSLRLMKRTHSSLLEFQSTTIKFALKVEHVLWLSDVKKCNRHQSFVLNSANSQQLQKNLCAVNKFQPWDLDRKFEPALSSLVLSLVRGVCQLS